MAQIEMSLSTILDGEHGADDGDGGEPDGDRPDERVAGSPTSNAVDVDGVLAAAKLLGRANKPLIIVGGGAQGASPEITDLAEQLQAPVVAHRMGRGVLDSRNPLSVTLPVGNSLWEKTDVVLAVGTRLHIQQMEWGLDDGLKVIRIDSNPDEPNRFHPADLSLVGESSAVLAELLRVLPKHNKGRPSRTSEISALTLAATEKMKYLQPQIDFLEVLRAELPEDGIIVEDSTQLGFAGRLLFPVYKPRTYLSSGYQGTLGWSFATALGVKVAMPDTPVISLTGDGGFMFNVQELATAVQHRIWPYAEAFDLPEDTDISKFYTNQFVGK